VGLPHRTRRVGASPPGLAGSGVLGAVDPPGAGARLMAHYHIRVRDAGGSWASTQLPKVKSPTIKPPRAAPAKPPAVPKTPGPPKPNPNPAPPRQQGAKPVSATARIAKGIGRVASVGERLARSGERKINRVAEFGEEFNRDSGGATMGHYHFNIPSRGSKLRDKRRMRDVDTGGGMSSTGGGMSSTAGGMSSTMGGMSSTSGMGMDAGTSEGAKKAAQTRSRGGGFQPRTAGGFGGAAAAKSHPEGFVQGVGPAQSKPKPAPEPFRGYDKKSWW